MATDLTSNDISEITRQSDVRSKALRDNFTNLKNKINEQNTSISNIGTAASGAEITSSRPNHVDLESRLDSIQNGQPNYVKNGGAPSERLTPDMTVGVAATQAKTAGVDVRLGFATWTRSGTTITATSENHPLSNTDTIEIKATSDATPVPLGDEVVSNVSGDDFDFTGVGSGCTSGTLEFAIISGTITAPSVNPRLDYIVMQSDNTYAIVTGAEAVDPVFPTVATTQVVVGCLVLQTGTTSLNDNVEIFTLKHNDNLPDHYIGTALDLPQGNYKFNNLIVDAQIDLDFVQTGDITNLIGYAKAKILCEGNFITTTSGVIIQKSGSDPAATNCSAKDGANGSDGAGGAGAGGAVGVKIQTDKQNLNGGHSGKGGDPTGAGSGAGGGGGGAIFAAGGNGGAGIGGSFGGAGQALVTSGVGLLIKAQNIKMLGAITLSGKDGVDDPAAGGGASGGSGAGSLILIAIKDIDINMTFTSPGGDGGDSDDGGAGGGGAGGSIFLYYLTITDNLTTSFAGGSGGTSTNATNGVAGSTGIESQKQYDDVSTTLKDNLFDWEAF